MEQFQDPEKKRRLLIKRIISGITIIFGIITLLTFFATEFTPQYKLLLSLFILGNGLLILAWLFLRFKKFYSLIGTIAGLLIILGILPIMVGLKATNSPTSLNIPLLAYQLLSIVSTIYFVYIIYRKPYNDQVTVDTTSIFANKKRPF